MIYAPIKRLIEVALCIVLAAPVAMVVGLAALLIWVREGRPIFFMQDRVGLNGRVFEIVKLRTMRPGPPPASHATLRRDPRITPLGRLLRQSHIDELPQLWNIFIGDMSFIGPRPEQSRLVDTYRTALPNYDRRHLVKPGLSGLAQVRFGYATDLSETREKLGYDLEYVENFGPALDLKIVALTIRVYADPSYVR